MVKLALSHYFDQSPKVAIIYEIELLIDKPSLNGSTLPFFTPHVITHIHMHKSKLSN